MVSHQTLKQTVRTESHKSHSQHQALLEPVNTANHLQHQNLAIDTDLTCVSTPISTNKMESKRSPNTAVSNQDLSDALPEPRIASGTLPPQAAHAPEFIPGEKFQPCVSDQHTDTRQGDRKASDVSSDKEKTTEKRKRTKKCTKAEKEAKEKAQKQQAMDEEWWSGDEAFVPNLKNKEGLGSNEQN